MAVSPVVRDTELALNLRARGWLFFPGLAPLLLPLPHPCRKRTLGSAGPAQRSSLLGLCCCLYCNQSPPCRGVHHPVLRSRCCCCCVCHGFAGNRRREEGQEGRAGKRDEKYRRGGTQREGGEEKEEGNEKRSYPKEGAFTIDWKGKRKLIFPESASRQPLVL